mmetsp:Transcript_11512/g.35747  ORF Transcript_11512/g.35747 Transcript_11512/m.35747 type:complete len:269 (+) Transcript_11512:819-1625(+)
MSALWRRCRSAIVWPPVPMTAPMALPATATLPMLSLAASKTSPSALAHASTAGPSPLTVMVPALRSMSMPYTPGCSALSRSNVVMRSVPERRVRCAESTSGKATILVSGFMSWRSSASMRFASATASRRPRMTTLASLRIAETWSQPHWNLISSKGELRSSCCTRSPSSPPSGATSGRVVRRSHRARGYGILISSRRVRSSTRSRAACTASREPRIDTLPPSPMLMMAPVVFWMSAIVEPPLPMIRATIRWSTRIVMPPACRSPSSSV